MSDGCNEKQPLLHIRLLIDLKFHLTNQSHFHSHSKAVLLIVNAIVVDKHFPQYVIEIWIINWVQILIISETKVHMVRKTTASIG